MTDGRALQVNLLESSTVVAEHEETTIDLRQETGYPGVGRACLHLSMSRPVAFPLAIRVPEHTRDHRLALNGEALAEPIVPGDRVTLNRTWHEGDHVELRFEPEVWRAALSDGSAAVVRGVEVLAADSRDQPLAKSDHGLVQDTEASLQEAEVSEDGRRRYRGRFAENGRATALLLTPFAVAGNPSVGRLSSTYRTAFPAGDETARA
jgi:DUF1680 family protein